MNRQDAFSGYSPQVNFIFYIGTVFFTVLIVHPAFLICSLVLAAVYYLQVRGRQGLRTIVGMIPVFVVVSAINPLLNTGGDRALFYLGQLALHAGSPVLRHGAGMYVHSGDPVVRIL